MTESAQRLLDMYRPDGDGISSAADVHQSILEMQAPDWGKFPATSQLKQVLSSLQAGQCAADVKAKCTQETVAACMSAMAIKEDPAPLQYIVTILYDMLREDTSCFSLFEDAMKDRCEIYKPLMGQLERSNTDPQWIYVADKSAWILTSVMGRMPRYFQDDRVLATVNVLMTAQSCSELGRIEAITNLLKAPFRDVVWSAQGVQNFVLSMTKSRSSPIVYKCVFAIWMISFEPSLMSSLKSAEVIKKLKSIMTESRVEKVIRLCVTVLKNFLAQKRDCHEICEDIVEEGVLEAVQQLEYEKWRDQELYDDIRELVALITSEVKELSNFDRYMRELESGSLSWGFIHSSKFFGENILKFDNAEFKALKLLASLLSSADVTTLAVACHDIGEFVSLHPLGKKQVGRLGVKERVMELMSSTEPNFREVRREALLCCQKIMLNKWQDVAAVDKK
eukprot:CAMPEP_0169084984 /NCGR_PEP_ID=MMETSP1015-20121227/12915_1 /TAXON_ID=342587 /ORGANISM="Karlodinium micrum, Strain CCMP2283" /LENGTH=449 /DNA_ID=CAMNT_0009145035 /DNA_START=83 /DNA_END=1432 /DNA_ORIENTATION=+